MKVPYSIEETFIPMEVDDHVPLWEHRRLRDEHWARLKRAKVDCPTPSFYPDWLEKTYGLKVHLEAAMITDNYTVVDEKKYTMYLLKYSQ